VATTKIMDRMRRGAVLAACGASLSIPACATEEIAPPPQVYVGTVAGPNQGAVLVTFAPGAATFDEEQAWVVSGQNFAHYSLIVDGALVARGPDAPIVLDEGSEAGIGYLPAGQHHLVVAAPNGGAPIVALDADIVAGAQNELYLFGPRGAVQGRLVSYPTQPPAGTMHVSAVNLIQGGTTVEVVACPQGAACTSLSPPLALGDAFEFELTGLTVGKWPYYTLPGDAMLGLREIPTATLATPPVWQLSAGYSLVTPASLPDPPANMVIAPVYVDGNGTFLWLYE
jgi:hypothetical protein